MVEILDTFRLVGAPDQLLERTHPVFSRLINAPSSVVGHDDLEMYERAQDSLQSDVNPWVNMQRLFDPAEGADQPTAETLTAPPNGRCATSSAPGPSSCTRRDPVSLGRSGDHISSARGGPRGSGNGPVLSIP